MREKIHRFERLSGYFGCSITACGLRVNNATQLVTKDEKIVNCKNCLRKMKKK